MRNLTDQGEIRVPGCQSCLVKPSCKGRLQLPNAGLLLTPETLTCIQESSDIVRILPTPSPLTPLIRRIDRIRRIYPSGTDGRCPSEFTIALKVEFSRFA